MDDLLREFLTETSESLDTVDNQLVKFEQEPNNAKILDNIFRLVHTIKGTCGFLGLPRLEALAHAGETLMGKFRDGMPVTGQAVTVILSSIDRIKEILAGLEATEAEPEGNDRDLIDKLEAMVEQGMAAMAAGAAAPVAEAPPLVPEAPIAAAAPAKDLTTGTLIDQTLERPLRPGEVSLDELERAFRETAIEAPAPVAKAEAAPAPAAEAPAPAPAAKEAAKPAKEKAAPKKSMADEGASEGDRIANQSI
ncbi:Hpt domain-containing protein, partial [Bradyrhizobium sp. WYCCWR 12699]|uniref:Hpt domain-containing protein n=1 Tax=Bradyrhizobium sp. WYCCWR 12699 TaxID=3064203 RepID=UPI0028A3683C